jgi:hypothetical protein
MNAIYGGYQSGEIVDHPSPSFVGMFEGKTGREVYTKRPFFSQEACERFRPSPLAGPLHVVETGETNRDRIVARVGRVCLQL